MLVVWCPDWPVVAAGAPPDSLTAVVYANRVVACSAAARAEGVRPGLRRREAQERCPELELLAHDPARDARAFEPVLVAVEQLTPWVEVLQPGECAFPARGAARYHGGEPALAVTVTAAVHAALEGRGGCQVGIADGTFAAALAAHHQAIVPPGGSRAFLAPLPVATLDRPDLADLLVRLGLRTLGDLAALPSADLATRFGAEGARAARLAGGLDEHPRGARRPPPDLRVEAELDPPADRVDVAAFTAKTLADDLVARLARLGLACTRLRVEARTDQGETLSRVWRHDPTPMTRPSSPDPVPRSASGRAQRLGPAEGPGRRPQRPGPAGALGRVAALMTERVRWQLDGWLTGRAGRLPGALTRLVLVPDEVVPDRGRQLGFWGEETEAEQRAARALARIQGLLGPEAVHTARLRGGRDPADRVTLTPATDPPPPGSPASDTPEAGPGSGSPGSGTPGAGTLGSGNPGSGSPTLGSSASDFRVLDFRVPAPMTLNSRIPDPTALHSTDPDSTPPNSRAPVPTAPDPRDPDPPTSGSPRVSDPAASLLPRIPGRGRPVIPAPGVPDRRVTGAPGSGPSGARSHDAPGASNHRPPGARGHGRVAPPRTGPGALRGAVPWPGQVPAPAPAIVHAEPLPAEVVDATGATVAVDGRGLLGPLPSRVRIQGRAWSPITAWAGPWLVDERWWDPAAHRRLVRLQATTDQGAYLLRLTGGRWWVEATYD
jgi:protein ImuB